MTDVPLLLCSWSVPLPQPCKFPVKSYTTSTFWRTLTLIALNWIALCHSRRLSHHNWTLSNNIFHLQLLGTGLGENTVSRLDHTEHSFSLGPHRTHRSFVAYSGQFLGAESLSSNGWSIVSCFRRLSLHNWTLSSQNYLMTNG
jgi:hypothetical protein